MEKLLKDILSYFTEAAKELEQAVNEVKPEKCSEECSCGAEKKCNCSCTDCKCVPSDSVEHIGTEEITHEADGIYPSEDSLASKLYTKQYELSNQPCEDQPRVNAEDEAITTIVNFIHCILDGTAPMPSDKKFILLNTGDEDADTYDVYVEFLGSFVDINDKARVRVGIDLNDPRSEVFRTLKEVYANNEFDLDYFINGLAESLGFYNFSIRVSSSHEITIDFSYWP